MGRLTPMSGRLVTSPVSPSQKVAKNIVRKYRRRQRWSQVRQLKMMVPSTRGKMEVEEADILLETALYIQSLELQLLQRVNKEPCSLQQGDRLDRLRESLQHCDPAGKKSSDSGKSGCSKTAAGPVKLETLQKVLQQTLQPRMQKKLELQRLQDQANIR